MKKFVSVLICACALFSCSDAVDFTSAEPNNSILELSQDEIVSIAFDNPRILNEDEVLEMVNNFTNSVIVKTRGGVNPKATIKGKYYLKEINGIKTRSAESKNDSIPLYQVFIEDEKDKGYAIVSADERSAGVIAYVKNGNFEKRYETGAGMMLELSEATLLSEISKIEKLKATQRTNTMAKVAKLLGKEDVTYNDIKNLLQIENPDTRSIAYDTPQSTIMSLVGPVTKTEWSQSSPYNLYLPQCYDPDWHFLTHYPAGCGIIAGVQALAAVASSNITVDNVTIDWSQITSQPQIDYDSYLGGDYTGMNMVATLVKDMYEETETTPNIDEDFEYGWYDDTTIPAVSSSSTGSLAIMNYLKKYVYCGTYYSQYAPDPLLSTLNVNQRKPCVAIMGGTHAATSEAPKGSHAWVIDGYAICQKTTRDIVKNYDLYFHANMGWGGTDSGYYKVNSDATTDFETTLGTYDLNFWEITEIRSN